MNSLHIKDRFYSVNELEYDEEEGFKFYNYCYFRHFITKEDKDKYIEF